MSEGSTDKSTSTAGKHRCDTCHGSGKISCTHCHGKKKNKCKKCKGHGHFSSCKKCQGGGEMICPRCDGEGKKDCPVCDHGKVKKTRRVVCEKCHGTGLDPDRSDGHSCIRCHRRGYVEERYEDYCPNCHGDYKGAGGKCSHCKGEGFVKCTRCNGTGHAICQDCGGSGEVDCDRCHGTGYEKCPELLKEQAERRKIQQAKEEKENEAKRAAAAARRAAEDRQNTKIGCGCVTVILVLVCLVIWGPNFLGDTWYGHALLWIRTAVWSVVSTIAALICAIFQFLWELITK